MSLLHAYHPDFRQVWTRVQAVDENGRASETQSYTEALQYEQTISNFLAPQH
jgi:hypothetical protein